jgi:hypothetical protein
MVRQCSGEAARVMERVIRYMSHAALPATT